MRAAKEAAEAANRAKSAVLAQISQELRPSITAIIGDSERLQDATAGDGQAPIIGDLQRIAASGKHLLALINDARDLAEPDGTPQN